MRGPNGERFVRRFWRSKTTVSDLTKYYKKMVNQNLNTSMVIPFPKKDLTELSHTLEQYQFGKSESIMVKHL